MIIHSTVITAVAPKLCASVSRMFFLRTMPA